MKEKSSGMTGCEGGSMFYIAIISFLRCMIARTADVRRAVHRYAN